MCQKKHVANAGLNRLYFGALFIDPHLTTCLILALIISTPRLDHRRFLTTPHFLTPHLTNFVSFECPIF